MTDLRAVIARRLLLPIARWKEGRHHFNQYLREFEQSQYYSPERLRDLQSERLQALIAHAYQHTAYYRRQFDEAGIDPASIRDPDDLERLPTLSKPQVQADLADLLAENYPLDKLTRDYTGGSTGTALKLYRDQRRGDARLAVGLRHDRWTGWEVGERAAYIWGAPRDFGPVANLRWRLSTRLVHRLTMLDALILDQESMARFAVELKRWRPALIVSYASVAYVFAKFLLERALEVPPPKAVIVTADLLQPHQRPVIEKGLGAPVFNRYGARELGIVSSECAFHQGLHLAVDSLCVEVLANGRRAAPGQPGEIVVTDLLNYGMPLIRYRLGDVGVLADRRCDCGRGLPLMDMVSGRITDFLITPAGTMIWAGHIPMIAIASRPGFEQVQIIQEARDRLVVKVVPGPRFVPADLEYFDQKMTELMGPGVTFVHELVKEIPRGPGGKHQFCICKVPTDLTRDVLSNPA